MIAIPKPVTLRFRHKADPSQIRLLVHDQRLIPEPGDELTGPFQADGTMVRVAVEHVSGHGTELSGDWFAVNDVYLRYA